MSAFLLVWAGCAFPMEEWVLNSCTAMVPDVVHLVRSLLKAAARHKFHINCSAPGYFGSRVPNAFSPFHWQAFHQLSLNGDRQPTVISLPLWQGFTCQTWGGPALPWWSRGWLLLCHCICICHCRILPGNCVFAMACDIAGIATKLVFHLTCFGFYIMPLY